MADILVRGMEMPGHCYRCPLRDKDDDHCVLQPESVETDSWDFQMEHCPLLPLPEGHGDLIDRDALQAKFELMENAFAEHGRPYSFAFKDGGEMCAEWWTVQDALSREPTIVPAEGGTDDG